MIDYICTNCSRPTSSLYKVYSSPGSIQLTTCQACLHDIDPYIEREWLLVAMDCVLHRPEALRHVMYNREPCSSLASDESSTSYRRLMHLTFMTTLLRVYLWYTVELEGDKEDPSQHADTSREALHVLLQSFVGDLITIVSTALIGSLFLGKNIPGSSADLRRAREPMDSKIYSDSEVFFFSKIYLAVTMPIFFHIVTVCVLIWENSSTIFMIGELFVLSLQRVSVAIVMKERHCNIRGTSQVDNIEMMPQERGRKQSFVFLNLPLSFPFIVGQALRVATQVTLFDPPTQLCTQITTPITDIINLPLFCVAA
ncbi:hypothetical protein ACHAWX_000374 [Stephanocyclus meneghinianus]